MLTPLDLNFFCVVGIKTRYVDTFGPQFLCVVGTKTRYADSDQIR